MNSTIGRKPLTNFGSPGRMDTDQGRTKLGRGGGTGGGRREKLNIRGEGGITTSL